MAIVVVVGCTVLVAKGPEYVLAFVVQMVFVVPVQLVAVLFVVRVPIVVEGVVLCLTTPVVPAARNVLAAVIAMTVVREGVLAVAFVVVAVTREVHALVLVVVVVLPGEILDLVAFVAEGYLFRLTTPVVAAARNELAAVIGEVPAVVLVVLVAPGEIVVDGGGPAPVVGIVAAVDNRAVA